MKKFKSEKFSLNSDSLSIINGILLSDGYISGQNSLRIITSSYEFAFFILKSLPQKIWATKDVNSYKIFDKRTKKEYTCYRIYTHANEIFKELRDKWYQNGKKHIPIDVIINEKSLLFWYLGDGCLQQQYKEKRTNNIKLCTNSFLYEEINNILIPQLKQYNPRIAFTERKQPVILIHRNKCDEFLKYIGNSPFDEYKHKWSLYPYKNINIQKNGIKHTNVDIINKIIQDYKNNIPIKIIAKKLNIDISLAIFYCKKEGIYIPKRDIKKYKITLEKNTIIVDNLKKYCFENNICYSNMLKLANGKINKYKNYKIEKI